MQYRYLRYKINGNNDKWDWTADPAHLQPLNIDEDFSFFNPKAGIFWKINNNNNLYASFSVANKEPTRNNYTDIVWVLNLWQVHASQTGCVGI